MQLKWSRLHLRFDGTWRESDDCFGELSLRLLGQEIRGARTTDPKSKVDPATPHLTDFVWTRNEAAPQGSDGNAAAALKALLGQWKVVRVEQGPDEPSPGRASQRCFGDSERIDRFIFQNDHLETFSLRNGGNTTNFYGFQIHDGTTPMAIDFFADSLRLFTIARKDDVSANTVDIPPSGLGIFEIKGDRLKLYVRRTGMKSLSRPTNLANKPAGSDLCFVLERYRPPEDEIAVRGSWDVVRETDDGKVVSQQSGFHRICWFYENNVIDLNNVDPLQNIIGGRYVMESGASQVRRITITPSPHHGRNIPGIYKFAGEQLHIAYRAEGPRPEKFESTPGSGVTLLVLARSKPRAANPSNVAMVVDVAESHGELSIAKLPAGVTIELVGASDTGIEWWRPDGSALKPRPNEFFVEYGVQVQPNPGVRHVFLARIDNGSTEPCGMTYEVEPRFTLSGPMSLQNRVAPNRDAKLSFAANVPETSRTVTVRIGVSCGPWEDVASKTYSSGEEQGGSRTKGGNLSRAVESKDAVVVATQDHLPADEVRVVAVRTDGQQVEAWLHFEWDGERDGRQLTATFSKLALKQIREIKLQHRPYQWVEFRNVAIQPREAKKVPGTVAPSIDASGLSHRVPFEVGATYLRDGDRITIDEVRGTADTIKVGNMYEIKGTYRLASHDKATIAAYVTVDAREKWVQDVPEQKTQSTTVERGEGKFALLFYMWAKGNPHISLYADGKAIASVYFGTGDSLLKHGYWEASPNPDAELRQRRAAVEAELEQRRAAIKAKAQAANNGY